MIWIKLFIQNERWLYSCLFVFLLSCTDNLDHSKIEISPTDSAEIILNNTKAFASIRNSRSLIKQGDMILRTGNDFTSESLRRLSFRDKTYSHCGIASIENGSIFIYHCLGGEWNPNEEMRRDPLELFCNPYENRGFGIFNFNLDDTQTARLDSLVKCWYKKKVMFDMKFDLTTSDRLYCAEFVGKAYSLATQNQIIFDTTRINIFKYLAIDNLIINKKSVEIKRILFK